MEKGVKNDQKTFEETYPDLEPPSPSTGDTAHLVASAILSPLIGAPELFQFLFSPPLQKRQQVWMQEVVNTLRKLEELKGISIKKLAENEALPRCPKCGGEMILRTAKSGANQGGKFWGCSNYPQCRGIVSFDK